MRPLRVLLEHGTADSMPPGACWPLSQLPPCTRMSKVLGGTLAAALG